MRPSTFLFFVILAVVLAMLLTACTITSTPSEPEPVEGPGDVGNYEWYPMTTPDGLDLWCFDVLYYGKGSAVWCEEANPR